jgi:hypothetical protein
MEKQSNQNENEFYIGYMPYAGEKTASFVRRIVFGLGIVVISVTTVIVLSQRPFSTATFEYGIPANIQGQLFESPVPHLVAYLGQDVQGKPVTQTILLVGFGKAGASNVVSDFKKRMQHNVEGMSVNVIGNLIYGDGKSLMQVDKSADITKLSSGNSHSNERTLSVEEEQVTVEGEIVDPKCYFGVMKPGEDKPHRSCAIRCISGGIPPVFHAGNRYFILLDEDGKPVNKEVLPFVGDRISLSGNVVQMTDWNILKVNSSSFDGLATKRATRSKVLALSDDITICK